jgi:hypothetical protein
VLNHLELAESRGHRSAERVIRSARVNRGAFGDSDIELARSLLPMAAYSRTFGLGRAAIQSTNAGA